MNRDFEEMLRALSDAEADFMVIGAHAVAVYARPRATGDLDIWVRPTAANAERVWKALVAFGAPLDQLTRQDLVTDDLVFQIGLAPNRIDLLTTIGGVEFDEAWSRRNAVELWGLTVPVIGREDLIRSKRAAGRKRDGSGMSPTWRSSSGNDDTRSPQGFPRRPQRRSAPRVYSCWATGRCARSRSRSASSSANSSSLKYVRPIQKCDISSTLRRPNTTSWSGSGLAGLSAVLS